MEYMKMNIYLNCEHKLQRFLCCSIRCVCFPVVFFWFCFGQKSMDFSIDFWIFIPFTFRSSISSMTRDSFDCDCFFFVIPVISTLMWFHSNLELRCSLWWGLGTDSYVSCNLTLSSLIKPQTAWQEFVPWYLFVHNENTSKEMHWNRKTSLCFPVSLVFVRASSFRSSLKFYIIPLITT